MTFLRKSLASEAVFEGLGLHSGAAVTVRVLPGERGIWFRVGADQVQAIPENVTDTTRCTRLGQVSTIEHIMSALAALGITDAEIELSAGELPALDGASLVYFSGIRDAGTTLGPQCEVDGPFARIFEKSAESSIAIAKGDGHWRYLFETGDRWPGVQDFEVILDEATYELEVAPARTFGFESELDQVRAAGLARGLDETTALVLGGSGYVNVPKFADEPARHKLLDLIGDLYLAGVPPVLLDVVASRSGHAANVRAAARLLQAVRIVPAS